MPLIAPMEITTLLETAGPAVSLYMPTHRAGRETQQDPIRFRNLLTKAENKLASLGLSSADARELLAPARRLAERDAFRRRQWDGLCLFAAKDLTRFYRLPAPMETAVIVGPRFHIKPLLPLLAIDGEFYVLALSQQEIKLLFGSRYAIEQVELDQVPASLSDALRYDDPEAALQWHSGPTNSGGARRLAMFHGHGYANDTEQKTNILRYFFQVAQGIEEILAEQSAPLVLAGVGYLLPLYRQAASYAHITSEVIAGNQQAVDNAQLHRRAWEIVEPIFATARHKARAEYESLVGQRSQLVVSDLTETVLAAHDGRIETLFVALNKQVWGRVDAQKRVVDEVSTKRPDAVDLLDVAAAETLRHNGNVYALAPDKVPAKSGLAAVLRYEFTTV